MFDLEAREGGKGEVAPAQSRAELLPTLASCPTLSAEGASVVSWRVLRKPCDLLHGTRTRSRLVFPPIASGGDAEGQRPTVSACLPPWSNPLYGV